MLISRACIENDEDEIDSDSFVCDVCEAMGTTPDLTTFEYLPLKNRITSWFRSANSYRDLTSYLRSKLQHGQDTEGASMTRRYDDIHDGEWFKMMVHEQGGVEAAQNDLFLSLSTDGFQTFENQSYDCWPLYALIHNLHPSKRFLLKNVVPLGYIKGPVEPTRLDTFFIPLVNELKEINSNGGMTVARPDGSPVKVRVHILWITGDKPAKNKMAGLAGHNSKTPCEECCIQGLWCPNAKHYYFPSKVSCVPVSDGERRRFEVLFDIERLPMRSVESVEDIWEQLRSSSLTQTARRALIRDTGVKQKTVLYEIESVTPFVSFPHDSMHHIMNVSKDLMELLKGENRHVARDVSNACNDFVISESSWQLIDEEIAMIGKGTSLVAFGPPPRPTSVYRQYKAAEWKEFFSSYALVLFEGHLPRIYLKGLRQFCRIVDLCRRPSVTMSDLDDLELCSKAFYKHMEECYYQYDRKRVGIMKSTLHSLLHLRGQIERYGPMTNFNQFWVERRVGDEKKKLHATIRAAESMTEHSKHFESMKIFYDEHFVSSEEENLQQEEDDAQGSLVSVDVTIEPLLPCTRESLDDPLHRSHRMRDLMRSYLVRKGIAPEEISSQLCTDEILVYGRLRVPCGNTTIVVGSKKGRRHRKDMGRADWYVSSQFESENDSGARSVYYGRVLQVFKYRFGTDSDDRVLVLIDWARHPRFNELGQVLIDSPMRSAFGEATVEDACIILNSVGAIEHKSERLPKRTYILDPYRDTHRLLEQGKPGSDGIVRDLYANRRR